MNSVIIKKIYEHLLSDEFKWNYQFSIGNKYDIEIVENNILIKDNNDFKLDKFYNTIHLVSILEKLKEIYPIDIITSKNNDLYKVEINKSKYRKYIIEKLK